MKFRFLFLFSLGCLFLFQSPASLFAQEVGWDVWLQRSKDARAKDDYEACFFAGQRACELALASNGKYSHPYFEALMYLADSYRDGADYARSEVACLEASDIVIKLYGKESKQFAQLLSYQGILSLVVQDFETGIGLYKESLRIYRAALGPNSSESLGVMVQLGFFYGSNGYFEEAKSYLEPARDSIAKYIGVNSGLHFRARSQLARCYYHKGFFGEAHEQFSTLKATLEGVLADSAGMRYSGLLMNMGKNLMKWGKGKEALACFEKSLPMSRKVYGLRPDYIGDLNQLGMLYVSEEDWKRASVVYDTVIPNRSRWTGQYFGVLSERAQSFHWRIMEASFEPFQFLCFKSYGQMPEMLGKWYDVRLFSKSILMNTSSLVRSRAMADSTSSLSRDYRRWLELKRSEMTKLSVSSEETMALERKIQATIPNFMVSNPFEDPQTSWRSVKSRLKKGEAALEIVRVRHYKYDWTDTVSYVALLIRKDMDWPVAIPLGNGAALEGPFLKYYLQRISNKLTDELSYSRYWEPIQQHLKGITKVYCSLDGVYYRIALGSLGLKDGVYLADKLSIVVVSSTASLLQEDHKETTNSTKSLVLLGNPEFEIDVPSMANEVSMGNATKEVFRDAFSPLTGAEEEVKAIAALGQKHHFSVSTYLGKEANEDILLSQPVSPEILHLATHGYFWEPATTLRRFNRDFNLQQSNEEALMRSGVFLAGAKSTLEREGAPKTIRLDGVFTASEARLLNCAQTKLVVLAACETGRGEIVPGEGILGIQRAFHIAGAEHLLISLWKVDDQATRLLMLSFYEHYLKYKDPHAALVWAQKVVRKKWKAPLYWAGFMLSAR